MVNSMGTSRYARWKAGLVEPRKEYDPPGLFDGIRLRFLKLLYEVMFCVIVSDPAWQRLLIASVAPKTNCRVLSFGRGCASVARALALRFPGARVVVADPNPKSIEKARWSIVRHNIPNLMAIKAPRYGPIPSDKCSFDKVMLVLTFHNRPPEEKLGVAKEMLRVLRHGGTLHAAAFDKPAVPKERGFLTITRNLSGPTVADSHLDGTWIEFLAKAGFIRIRRQLSYSIGVARISVVKARKP